MKKNIYYVTFFIGNQVSNIFLCYNFFEESPILRENGEKIFVRCPFFREGDHLTPKMNITFFIKI